jgi:hypothetical protein
LQKPNRVTILEGVKTSTETEKWGKTMNAVLLSQFGTQQERVQYILEHFGEWVQACFDFQVALRQYLDKPNVSPVVVIDDVVSVGEDIRAIQTILLDPLHALYPNRHTVAVLWSGFVNTYYLVRVREELISNPQLRTDKNKARYELLRAWGIVANPMGNPIL